MPSRVPLNAGAYTARSLIANCQRCVNLIPEINPQDTGPPVVVTHNLTPGLTPLIQPSTGTVRGMWRASNGALIVVIGANVYFVDLVINFGWTLMGTIAQGTTPVSMADNGAVGVIVDGTAKGYYWVVGNTVLFPIVDAAFYGANFVCYLDGYFIFNRPATNQFYVSPVFWNGTDALDPLYIASKIGGPDQIIAVASIHRELWLIGQITSEVWFNSGAADFPFERLPGVFVDHGMIRGWSIAQADESLLWLGRDRQGQLIVFQSDQYNAVRVSNHALEFEMQQYEPFVDAIGFCYQQEGHTFYVLVFPTADKTWVYDLATKLWHERTWTDGDGVEHRHRANCALNVYNRIICGDWQSGDLYKWDLGAYTDNGVPIVRRRGFPHLTKDSRRVSYDALTLDMQVGDIHNLGDGEEPTVMLRWSDTRGASWGNPVTLPVGSTGDYYRSLQVQRLGMARDRVFEVFWSFPYKTALQGPWVTASPAET